jgi:hypothetical protein
VQGGPLACDLLLGWRHPYVAEAGRRRKGEWLGVIQARVNAGANAMHGSIADTGVSLRDGAPGAGPGVVVVPHEAEGVRIYFCSLLKNQTTVP